MKLVLGVLVSVALLPFVVAAEGTGVVPGTIWLSDESPDPGKTVAIYTAVYNGGGKKLSGTVEFLDGETSLGKKTFLVPSGEVVGVSISWKVTAGRHSFSARITEASYVNLDGTKEKAEIERSATEESKTTVAPTLGQATETGKEFFASTTNKIVDVALEKIPEPVKEQTAAVHKTIEAVRTDNAKVFEEKSVEAEKKIAAGEGRIVNVFTLREAEDSGTTTAPKGVPPTPFDYAAWLFFGALAFIFKHALVFYGSILFLAHLITRFIIRRFHHQSY